LPISERHIREPGRLDWLADNKSMRTHYREDYANWFLYQLLARQIDKTLAERSPESFKACVFRLSYSSFRRYGEEIFD
jgi:hypothetical protein